MRLLTIGDVVGVDSIEYLRRTLWPLRRRQSIDFVVANGENASNIHGLCARDAQALLDCGIDLITLGNHAFGCKDIGPFLDNHPNEIIRPANYPAACPGYGSTIRSINGVRWLCMNVSGVAFLDSLDNPFSTVEKMLQSESGRYDAALLDVHAEATSEKMALGRFFDGRIQVLFGTHTHVPTADEQILPAGTGYITDIGMTGPTDGILGVATQDVLTRMITRMPSRFTVAQGTIQAQGALFTLTDDATPRVTSVARITF